ncbi:MAG: DinB family protein [Ignavibacteriales bacterium]|nr:MAG: DinB family protein [Ignavibacteriales bacterium]
MNNTYRKGAIGALMDIYEKHIIEFSSFIENTPGEIYEKIIDEKTQDEDCRSIQTIVSHVINSGFGYANYLRDKFGIEKNSPERKLLSIEEAIIRLNALIRYTIQTLEGKWEMSDAEILETAFKTRWGGKYDIEQLLEHAIVHILRHKRQIKRFLERVELE